MTRRINLDIHYSLVAAARNAKMAIDNAVAEELLGKKAARTSSGKLTAAVEYEEFRKVATPVKVLEVYNDLVYTLPYLNRALSGQDNKVPGGVKFVITFLYGLAMFIAGGFWQQWYTGG